MKKTYLLGITALTFFTTSLNAQIVYKDITDGVPTGIDFNSDATMEFDLGTGTNPGDYITYDSYGPDNNIHAIGTLATTDWDVPNCVAAGFTVDASNQWEGQGDCSLDAWGGSNPTITPNQDEYLAVRFNLVGASIYYGWIRFSMDNAGLVTYKDYAYNKTPNTAIKTGDKGSTAGITALENKINFSLYPNPAKDKFTVDFASQHVTEIKVIDLLGKEVNSISVSNATSQTIDISGLNQGIYLIHLFENGKQLSCAKLIVE